MRSLLALLPVLAAGCLPTPSLLGPLGPIDLEAHLEGDRLAIALAFEPPASRDHCERHPVRVTVDEEDLGPAMRWTGDRCVPERFEVDRAGLARSPVIAIGYETERYEGVLTDGGADRALVADDDPLVFEGRRWRTLALVDAEGDPLFEEVAETWAALALDDGAAPEVRSEPAGLGALRVKPTTDPPAGCAAEGCEGVLAAELATRLLVGCEGFRRCEATAVARSELPIRWIAAPP